MRRTPSCVKGEIKRDCTIYTTHKFRRPVIVRWSCVIYRLHRQTFLDACILPEMLTDRRFRGPFRSLQFFTLCLTRTLETG